MSTNIYDLKIKLFIFFVIFTGCGVSQIVFFSLVVLQSELNARGFKMVVQKVKKGYMFLFFKSYFSLNTSILDKIIHFLAQG